MSSYLFTTVRLICSLNPLSMTLYSLLDNSKSLQQQQESIYSSYGNSHKYIVNIGSICILALSLVCISASHHYFDIQSYVNYVVIFAVLVVLFIILRLSTFRYILHSQEASNLRDKFVFNHMETDEKIFQVGACHVSNSLCLNCIYISSACIFNILYL